MRITLNSNLLRLPEAVAILVAGFAISASASNADSTIAAGHRIDELIIAQCEANGIEPNASISDELFVRRIFTDVIGRIPTVAEARAFLDSTEPNKRSLLIDQLQDSEGRISHEFNYFADLLRIQSRMQNVPGQDYINWVKDALRSNKPYDVIVRELITAEGYIWENGAAGFYLRDPGMPLDHLANTVQVFLGTQLVCAQCHDHPYDDWSQMQYFQLAAYTSGVQTRDGAVVRELRAMNRRDRDADVSPETQRTARQLLRPLTQRVHETDQKLKLPADYQYDDAKPRSIVDPQSIFGNAIETTTADAGRTAAFASWLTSPENPRFTVVIANRVWEQIFGRALIDPIDDLGDNFEASNPELMSYLTTLMGSLNYDLKAFKRILFNTQAYQRASESRELSVDDPYYFQGPLPRRLSAEQIWDSLVAMVVPEVDSRPGTSRRDLRFEIGKSLEGMSAKEVFRVAEQQQQLNKARQEFQSRNRQRQKEIQEAQRTGDQKRVRELRTEQREQQRKFRTTQEKPIGRLVASKRDQQNSGSNDRWKRFPNDFVRASELPSPAPPSHFLRQLGQSDRETIENSNDDATVPQILTLINGPLYDAILDKNGVLMSSINEAETVDDKIETAFLGILSRKPTADERTLVKSSVSDPQKEAVADLLWALINTRQFSFYY